jgi:23S rRNA C2498 (ribose-2'-O)-methylase RlmM
LLLASGAIFDPCFARQVLPSAYELVAHSAADLAQAIFHSLDDEDEHALLAGVCGLQVAAPDFMRKGSAAPTAHPATSAAEQVADILKKKVAGRARKRGVEHEARPRPPRLLQVLVPDGWRAWVSLSDVGDADPLVAWPARFPAGRAQVSGFEDAPSSAYRKLVEALAWLDGGPGHGDVVLDLGAAPGGWSYVLLEKGAEVIAFDRAELDPRVAGRGGLTHIKKDAFVEAPLNEANWLVCDIIDRPERTLELIERAVAEPGLSGLAVTVKLTRPVDNAALDAARRVATTTAGFVGRAKQLVHNKCEITVLMRRAG